jgi:hypothetical protein
LSVRGNGIDRGAIVQARDGADASGLMLDYEDPDRPRLAVESGNQRDIPVTLAIENERASGRIVLSVGSGSAKRDLLVLDADGSIELRGDAVRLHGTKGSGRQVADPGRIAREATGADLAGVRMALEEQRTTLNRLRKALVEHGLLGATSR